MENRVKKKVLVVDDDVLSLKISRARLESAGYDVITSERAIGTLLIIIREKPDVILLDLNMPEIGGENFIQIMQDQFESKSVPVIFHSSIDMESLRQKALQHGALGGISKTNNDQLFIMQFERLFSRIGRS